MAMDSGRQTLLQEMSRDWPYFHAVLDMLEMVLAKADAAIAKFQSATGEAPADDEDLREDPNETAE